LHGAGGCDDADILAIRADQADFGRPDAIIDARAGFALWRGVVGSAGYGSGPSYGCKRRQDSLCARKLQPHSGKAQKQGFGRVSPAFFAGAAWLCSSDHASVIAPPIP